ncbi:MAG: NACHT domain-containing protein [Caldilineaceae bacterium]|nr:NACHT domain-containing protein [Caldilineaceae bacterium]
MADLLWYGQSEQKSKANLRYQLRDLRKIIGDYLVVDAQTVAFNRDLPHWIDTTSFMTYLAPSLHATTAPVELTILQELLNLYTGEFMAGFHIQDAPNFERWMLVQRRHFHDVMIYGLQLAAQQHLELGDYAAGLELNQYLLTSEPWREEAHRQRMILLAASGQRSAALMQYEICCQALEEELDVSPMDETTSLYKQIKSGLWYLDQKKNHVQDHQSVAVRAYPTNRNGIGPGSTGAAEPAVPAIHCDIGSMPIGGQLVGRRQEVAALNQWLADDGGQLIAILGLGGQGKSALAASVVQVHYINAQSDANSPYLQTQLHLRQPKHDDAQSIKHRLSVSVNSHEPFLDAENKYTHIIWRSLERRPSCVEILQDWILPFKNASRTQLPTNFEQLVATLFEIVEQHRCLFVLDGVDRVIQGDDPHAATDATAYEALFRLFTERSHRSCLLLTSRMRPAALTHLQRQNKLIRSLELEGFSPEDSQEFLDAHGFTVDSMHSRLLHQHYAGNPRLLRQAANLIHDLFCGDVAAYVQEELYFLGEMGATLDEQFASLSPLELQIMRILLESEEVLSRKTLWEQLSLPIHKSEYYQALLKMQNAYLIRPQNDCFQLAALSAIYLTQRAPQ